MSSAHVEPNKLYYAMLDSARRQGHSRPDLVDKYHHVALDPGETTGVAISRRGESHLELQQVSTPTVEEGMDALHLVLSQYTSWPTIVTIEDYKVYGWKADSHKWAGLHTPMLIGALRWYVHQRPLMSLHLRMAQQAKGFATDDNLKRWGIYEAGMKHARDAERHLVTTIFWCSDIQLSREGRPVLENLD